ncbi:flotillin family protein [Phenylobacterium soli]|nr:hypothetical protein [Phenylobacterium soli]
MELAERIQQDAMEAEQPETRAKLATAFHRISRSVRQTAALKLRLEREAKRAVREDQAAVRADRERQVDLRKTRIKARVEQLIWTEYEGEDADRRESILEDLLDADALEDDFLDLSPEAEIARLCMDLGLPNPPPKGEVSAKPMEGVEAHSTLSPAPQPPQSLRDSSPPGGPSRGASERPSFPRDNRGEDYWNSA